MRYFLYWRTVALGIILPYSSLKTHASISVIMSTSWLLFPMMRSRTVPPTSHTPRLEVLVFWTILCSRRIVLRVSVLKFGVLCGFMLWRGSCYVALCSAMYIIASFSCLLNRQHGTRHTRHTAHTAHTAFEAGLLVFSVSRVKLL